MNGLSNILNGVDGTEAIILGLGDAGRHSATLPDILDDSAVHPSLVYGSFTGMASTWDANLLYALLHTKLYAGDLTEAQGRIALKVLQLQGERQAYTTRPTNVAMTEKQQRAWDSVEPIIDKMRKVHQGDPTIRMLCNKCRTYGYTNALTDGDATLYVFNVCCTMQSKETRESAEETTGTRSKETGETGDCKGYK